MKSYDIVIVGGGPGGYVAAIKAAHLGAKVGLIEKERLGGLCLNWGCIPTKTLLKSAKLYQDLLRGEEFGLKGIDNSKVSLDWPTMMKRKDEVVEKLVNGVYVLFRKNKIDLYEGMANVKNSNEIEVDGEIIKAKNLIVATGSISNFPNIPGLYDTLSSGKAMTSRDALQLEYIPKELIIVGGGVIAIEFATLFNALGTEVTLLQRSEHILSGVESEIAETLEKHLIEEGVNIITSTTIKSINQDRIVIEQDGKEKSFSGDKYLISLGVKAQLNGLENLNLKLTKKGFVETNERLETNIKGVYALGDMNGKFPLAHVASAEGIVAVENIMGIDSSLNYDIIPFCIYSFPEIASVGLTESQAKAAGYDVNVSKFPLSANGKALAEGETLGFVKIISETQYGEILGTHIMASHATDMISEAIISMQIEGTIYDVAKAIHPHPTLSEIVMEAAHGAIDKPIHK